MSLFSGPFTGVFFSGTATTIDVPSIYPVAIAGHTYFIDTAPAFSDYRWRHESIPLLRAQADQAQSPAETTLNPDSLWRRAQDSFHRGAGQQYRDRDADADTYRFNASKGIDVWTRYQLSLLYDTDQKRSGASTNYRLAVAGSRLYLADGATLLYTTDITVDSPTWNTVTYAGGTILSLTSDGKNVYFTDGTNVYVTTTAITTSSVFDAADIDVVGFVKGRLLGAEDGEVFEYKSAAMTSLFSPDLTGADFNWVGFAEGDSVIYMAGFVGDKSTIWKTSIEKDGTALTVPSVAGTLPDGEIIRSIYGYLGNLYIGTDLGWRFANQDQTTGNLSIGVRVDTPGAVNSFEGQGRFVWFGWSNYDATSTGLGRIDPTEATGVPGANQVAYASDLMATGQGAVLSVATFQSIQVFTVSGLGVFATHTSLVATGTIDFGQVSFGLPDPKEVMSIHVDTRMLDGGSWSSYVSVNGAGFVQYGGTVTEADTTGQSNPVEERGELFEARIVLARDGSDTTAGPIVTRWTFKAYPAPDDGNVTRIYLPLLLHRDLTGFSSEIPPLDPGAEYDFLAGLRATREIIGVQEIDRTYTGTVDDLRFLPDGLRYDEAHQFRFPDGTALVIFKELR